MADYPPGWALVELGSCLKRIEAGRSPDLPDRPAEPGEWGVLKVSAVRPSGFRPAENKAVTKEAFVDYSNEVRNGDLLITRANTPQLVGLVCFVENAPSRLLLSDKTLRLVTDERRLIGKFAAHVLTTPLVRRQIEASGTGSSGSMKNISQNEIGSLRISLPVVEEQKSIVGVLDSLDDSIRFAERQIAKLEKVHRGLVSDLLDREPYETNFDRASGGIRHQWISGTVGEFGDVRLGRQRSPLHETGPYMKPYLRVANVYDGYIDLSDVLQMNFSPTEQDAYSVRRGDLLLNEGQSLELVGRCAKYDGADGVFCFQNTLIRYRCSDLLEPDFAYHTFSWWLRAGKFADIAKRTTSIAHLGADRFSRMPLVVPPKLEQERICAVLGSHVERVHAVRDNLTKLRLAKVGLVDDLLSGRVRM